MTSPKYQFLDSAVLEGRMRLQADLILKAFDMTCIKKLVRSFRQDKKAIMPDLHLLYLTVRWNLDSLLGVLLDIFNVNDLSLFAHVRSGGESSSFFSHQRGQS